MRYAYLIMLSTSVGWYGLQPIVLPTPRDRLKTICVHVSRKWELRGIDDDGPLQHIDLILADDKVWSQINLPKSLPPVQ